MGSRIVYNGIPLKTAIIRPKQNIVQVHRRCLLYEIACRLQWYTIENSHHQAQAEQSLGTQKVFNLWDPISFTMVYHCKQPSSGQRRTQYRYIEGVYSIGSHIVYNGIPLKTAIIRPKQNIVQVHRRCLLYEITYRLQWYTIENSHHQAKVEHSIGTQKVFTLWDPVSFTMVYHCKQPILGPSRTQSRCTEGVYSIGSHIVYNGIPLKTANIRPQQNTVQVYRRCLLYGIPYSLQWYTIVNDMGSHRVNTSMYLDYILL